MNKLFEVKVEFQLYFRIDGFFFEDRTEPERSHSQCPSDTHRHALRRSRRTAEESRFQLSSSRASCCLPSLVSA